MSDSTVGNFSLPILDVEILLGWGPCFDPVLEGVIPENWTGTAVDVIDRRFFNENLESMNKVWVIAHKYMLPDFVWEKWLEWIRANSNLTRSIDRNEFGETYVRTLDLIFGLSYRTTDLCLEYALDHLRGICIGYENRVYDGELLFTIQDLLNLNVLLPCSVIGRFADGPGKVITRMDILNWTDVSDVDKVMICCELLDDEDTYRLKRDIIGDNRFVGNMNESLSTLMTRRMDMSVARSWEKERFSQEAFVKAAITRLKSIVR
jgi:hypothetical protein